MVTGFFYITCNFSTPTFLSYLLDQFTDQQEWLQGKCDECDVVAKTKEEDLGITSGITIHELSASGACMLDCPCI
jgi:hypothetical protein